MTLHSSLVFALTTTLALVANAQTPAPELHIRLDDVLCRGVEQVSVVTNGRDRAFRAEKVSDCNWKLTAIGRHNLEISYFSLRFGGTGRTGCKRATAIDASTIQLVFTQRGRVESREIEIAIDGAALDYVRQLPSLDDGVPCLEKGAVPGTLLDVQFDIEDLRLRLFEKKPVACGVIVNDVLAKARKGDVVAVTSRELVPAVVKQGLRGRNCYAPTLTPPEALEPGLRSRARLQVTVK